MEVVKCMTPTATQLSHKCNINPVDIETDNSFIDLESVLNHMKKTPGPERTPVSMTYYSTDAFIDIFPKDSCRIRPYQKEILEQVVQVDTPNNTMTVHPTLVVAPCGSGKTLSALCCVATCRKTTLIITNYKIVACQWKTEALKHFNISSNQVQCIGDESFEFDHNNPPSICIITYDTLTSSLTSFSRKLLHSLLLTSFGLIVLDEAHKSVAFSYHCILSRLSGLFLAFTATPIREDSELKRMNQFVHSTFEIEAKALVKAGYISKISCSTILVPTDPLLTSSKLSHIQKIRAAVVNPNKIEYLNKLLATMTQNNERILIFCDDIWSLKYVFAKLKHQYPLLGPICMETTLENREKFVRKFVEEDGQCKILLISRTGDEGLDIPCASKLIQICTPWGSRRQHAQRVGRIQRAHNTSSKCEAITIVSKDTIEVEFARKRDKYLKEMKYCMNTIDITDITSQSENTMEDLMHCIQKSNTKWKRPKKEKKQHKITNNIQKLRRKLNKHH